MTKYIIIIVLLNLSCSGKSFKSLASKNKNNKNVDSKDQNKTVVNTAGFQVKSIKLLKSSIKSCLDENAIKIQEEMILPTKVDAEIKKLPDSKFAFLLPGKYKKGDNVIDKSSADLVDYAKGARSGVAIDALTASYLRALETIANVSAHNCSLDKKVCQCETTEKAKEMIERCLPSMDQTSQAAKEATEMLHLICSKDNGDANFRMRKAIASLLSSYAFAIAR